jgi:hypothetical protein
MLKPYPGVKFVRDVILKYDGKSMISGEANTRRLCIVLQRVEEGYSVDNAILVTPRESVAMLEERK